MIICGLLGTLKINYICKENMILNAKNQKAVRNVKSDCTSEERRLIKRTV